MEQVEVQPVTVTAAPALPAGDAKLFAAGKAAIAKAKTMDDLAKVTARMEARKGDLSDEQNEQLMQLALSREAELTVPADLGAFDDD
jgi:hypothetical protein